MQDQHATDAVKRWLGRDLASLAGTERRVLDYLGQRRTISRDTTVPSDDGLGARLADRVASFGGSWTFILIFASFLVLWCLLNLTLGRAGFDPYPFIFLNLILSMLAAFQAPIIMMSQNRQAQKDRLAAVHDYEVNLKAELEIMALHEKLDQLRSDQLAHLIAQQQAQLDMLSKALRRLEGGD
ncbi:hypothetical protein PARHAE_00803 [Paracoccus haematequi]|uniref:DUF1003 domain-containing protein n=1 Tax=Paracoccus haematequi TaxID=2491866 RepID=A0A447IJG5_9RHOB|nr:DUF1003 domain-containing protein [Paracoccus haematequi]VDS07626.1 hypothetical protein PARHAE_00803 [Paracoccus haematequi]